MATKKKPTGTKAAPKSASKAKAPAVKVISEPLSKSGIIAHVASLCDAELKTVRAVFDAIEATIAGAMHKKGVRQFIWPGLVKISAVTVAAKPKREGLDPFTKQMRTFEAKPASVRVKVRPLAKLKAAAA